LLGVPCGEVLGVGIQAERTGNLREHHRRRGQAEQGETGVRRMVGSPARQRSATAR
jgi:hypothetical protein